MPIDANGGTLGFEEKLFAAADKLRGHMDAAEYKHVVLGLIFLKYISDAFEQRRQELLEEQYADPEDPDEYLAENVFWVPSEARWSKLQEKARDPSIGQVIDSAMAAIEDANPSLKGVLSKNYARPTLDKRRLGELVDLVGTIGLGDKESRSQDVLGRVYEYFLGRFAAAEGKSGGEFYTPQSVVKLLVAMLEPYRGRIYDPCCGSGGMFVQSERFVEAHGGERTDIAIYGQESNPTTWRLCKMNLAIRGIEGNLGPHAADTFHNDLHRDLRADFILANPPFNISDWGGQHLKDDPRWKYGVPPETNANFGWIQHMIHHLAPDGVAGFVMANGSLSSHTAGEGEIREALVRADLVDCVVALPPQLFFTTPIPVSLWFITRSKTDGRFRDRSGEVLFIDARRLGQLADRTHRVLNHADIEKISETYHAWRGGRDAGVYEPELGFTGVGSLADLERHRFALTPGRYVGLAEDDDDDSLPFEEKMALLTTDLSEQLAESHAVEAKIRSTLKELGYDI